MLDVAPVFARVIGPTALAVRAAQVSSGFSHATPLKRAKSVSGVDTAELTVER
jgi:hypothetical protein